MSLEDIEELNYPDLSIEYVYVPELNTDNILDLDEPPIKRIKEESDIQEKSGLNLMPTQAYYRANTELTYSTDTKEENVKPEMIEIKPAPVVLGEPSEDEKVSVLNQIAYVKNEDKEFIGKLIPASSTSSTSNSEVLEFRNDNNLQNDSDGELIDPLSKEAVEIIKGEKLPYLCRLCGDGYPTFYTAKKHIVLEHDPKPCWVPKRGTGQIPRLGRSVTALNKSQDQDEPTSHTGEDQTQKKKQAKEVDNKYINKGNRNDTRPESDRKFKCQLCAQGFFTAKHLEQHLWIHTDVKPFECEICGRGFKQIGNLRTHMFTHTGEKPYKCTVCGWSFTTSTNLKRHKQTSHGVD